MNKGTAKIFLKEYLKSENDNVQEIDCVKLDKM